MTAFSLADPEPATPQASSTALPKAGVTSWTPVINVIAGLVYLAFFRQVYWSYISVEWGYTGLTYRELNFWEASFIYVSVGLVSWFLPGRVERASTVIIWFLYAIVYVPTLAITLMIGLLSTSAYLPSLTAFTAGMIIICVINRKDVPRTLAEGNPDNAFAGMVLTIFAIASAVIFYRYREIMTFASIDDVYVQRFIAADLTSGVSGYLRAYYGSFLAPLLIAIGIASRPRLWLIVPGALGFLMSYMIDASKISLVVPLVMVVAGLVFRWSNLRLYHMTGGMVVVCMVSAALTESTRAVRFIADLILLRTISIPAQTFAQYFDVFYNKGYTWWSNVTGLNLVIPPPRVFMSDQFWPVLGQMVGAEYYGFQSRVNLNANPFVGEGVAAAGWFGVLAISLAIAFFLRALDRSSIGWNRHLVLSLMVPIGLTLTNVHLSTFLVSFGGVAWLLLFRYYKPVSEGIGRNPGVGSRP